MPDNSKSDLAIQSIQHWIQHTVIKHHFCPFAKSALDKHRVHFIALPDKKPETQLTALIEACEQLDSHPDIETTLLIFTNALDTFDDFLDALELANTLLDKQGYTQHYQIAHFHPKYQFADTRYDDIENITNRSPWPIWQLLRNDSIEAVGKQYDLDGIPERNIQYCRDNAVKLEPS